MLSAQMKSPYYNDRYLHTHPEMLIQEEIPIQPNWTSR